MEINVCLLKNETEISAPMMRFHVPPQHLTAFIDDMGKLGKYAPIALVTGDNVITGYKIHAEGWTSIQGQPLQRIET